jgi:hypothetical protein
VTESAVINREIQALTKKVEALEKALNGQGIKKEEEGSVKKEDTE